MARTFLASYLPEFRRDIRDVIAWSAENYGDPASHRYGELVRQALRDLLEDPIRPGARARADLAPGAYVYHLTFSRERVFGDRVKVPRHFVLYRYREGKVEFARLIHDSRDLARHVPDGLQDE